MSRFASLHLAAGLLAALALAGCATTEDKAHVAYAAHGGSAAAARGVRVSVTAQDARLTNRGRISTKKNGYGMDMAAIRSADDVAEVVKMALADELRARGYDVAPGGAVVEAKVTTFYNDFEVGMFAGSAKGQVDLSVTVVRAGAQVYAREIKAMKRKTVAMATGSNAAAAISLALGEAMDQLFGDPAFIAALAA